MNIIKSFPDLKPEERDREYRKYSEELRDKVIYEFLFNAKSNRWIDENILLEDQEYSRGWYSMGILHHLGLRDAHKGFFKEISIEDAINHLTELGKDEYNPFIAAFKRYAAGTYDLYNENSLDMFAANDKFKKLLKPVGKSQYTDGVRIDKDFHEIFNPTDSKFFTPRGKAREIKVLFNNKIFKAEYRFEDQEDKRIILQSIRFRKELKIEFEKVFPTPEGEFTIEVGSDFSHFIFSHIAVTVEDDHDPETDTEYSEGKEYYRLHRMRERKSEVVKQAKKLFVKKHGRLFCEVCSTDFSKIYGDRGNNFIEGHHRRLVSEMKEGDKTKAEDIAMLCSNCHRMIHKKPIISVEHLAMIVNGQ
jgi:hypothetical protein